MASDSDLLQVSTRKHTLVCLFDVSHQQQQPANFDGMQLFVTNQWRSLTGDNGRTCATGMRSSKRSGVRRCIVMVVYWALKTDCSFT
jgi:hypothetical protein